MIGKTRHQNQKALDRNMKSLGITISNVVHEMNPAAICMCEVNLTVAGLVL